MPPARYQSVRAGRYRNGWCPDQCRERQHRQQGQLATDQKDHREQYGKTGDERVHQSHHANPDTFFYRVQVVGGVCHQIARRMFLVEGWGQVSEVGKQTAALLADQFNQAP